MQNNSGLLAAGFRILVRPIEVEAKSAGGIIVATDKEVDRMNMGQVECEVVHLGPMAFSGRGEPWCAVGDTIICRKYAGLVVKGKDEVLYRLIDDLDVCGVKK